MMILITCFTVVLYKLAYYPASPDDDTLWNPRQEPFSKYFLELDNGTLHPLTLSGSFTLARLRLNRPPLIAYRPQNRQLRENIRLLNRYKELVELQSRLNRQLAEVTEEQQRLLEEQQRILKLLLGGSE